MMTEAWDAIMTAGGLYAVWRFVEVSQDATYAALDIARRWRHGRPR